MNNMTQDRIHDVKHSLKAGTGHYKKVRCELLTEYVLRRSDAGTAFHTLKSSIGPPPLDLRVCAAAYG